jgi:hypothetical protein
VANLATSVTKSATSATLKVTKKTATTVTKTANVGFKATKAAAGATKTVSKFAAKTATKGVKKFGLFAKRRKNKGDDGSSTNISADDDFSESETSEMGHTHASTMPIEVGKLPTVTEQRKRAFVEICHLEAVDKNSSEGSASPSAAKARSYGQISLRGGIGSLPVAVFGGPVLCVATKNEANDEGSAHFYTRKQDSNSGKASEYIATGPTLPFPDHVVWDDDGIYCAVIAHNRVAIYHSDPPTFVLIGSVRIALSSCADSRITSARFVHGVLYCCTVVSVHAGKSFLPCLSCAK